MSQIEIQLRSLDYVNRLDYKNHLKGILNEGTLEDTQRRQDVILLIDKINSEK